MSQLARGEAIHESEASSGAIQQSGQTSQTVVRLLEANRAIYDRAQLPHGVVRRRIESLESALAEATVLQHRLQALETSTTWRLTGPLRWALGLLRKPPAAPPPPPQAAPLAVEPHSYRRWIDDCEPASLARLAQDSSATRATGRHRLGIVLLPHAASEQALARLQPLCPPACQILALQPRGGPALAALAEGDTIVQAVAPDFTAADAVRIGLNQLDCDLLCVLDPRDTPAVGALRLVADCADHHPECGLIYGDEDWLLDGERCRPFFKPSWDCELQQSRDLLGPFIFFRTKLLRQASPAAGPAWLYDLANQVCAAARPEHILHIPAVLCHRAAPPLPPEAWQGAAQAQLRRQGVAGQATALAGLDHRVSYQLPAMRPLVSIIVPTRDHADFLSVCADALLHRTDYPRLELLIIDNGSVTWDALALLDHLAADPRVRVLREPGPFNWSKLNNIGAREASGDVLLLLNNDIDVLKPNWLSVLVAHAIQPGVGAVGPKMLYPDGRVQHAGLTIDAAGMPRHLFRFEPGDSAGPFEMMAAARQVWAITGACIAICRDVFWAAGGLNEGLPVTYNDIDLCVRLTACGYRIVWTPWSTLEHRELGSRSPDHLPEQKARAQEEMDRLLRDWGSLVLYDPTVNPNLHVQEERLCYGPAPKV